MRFSRIVLLSLFPAALLMGVFLIGIAFLILSSLTVPSGIGLGNYIEIVERQEFRMAFFRTMGLAGLTTIISAIISYPVARAIDRAGKYRTLMTAVLIVPWMVSIVVRSYGWIVLLGNRGTINTLLQWLGMTHSPLPLLFNQTGAVIGLVHVFCPFLIISLLAVMQQTDRTCEEAAMSLGAGPIQTFIRVTLPLTSSGLASGCAIVFLLSSGAVLTPLLLGGSRNPMLAVQIYQDVFQLFNFSRASAMAFILVIGGLVVIAPLQWLEHRINRRLPTGAK
jgi:putative spermidine/putrescine transport system permease protein